MAALAAHRRRGARRARQARHGMGRLGTRDPRRRARVAAAVARGPAPAARRRDDPLRHRRRRSGVRARAARALPPVGRAAARRARRLLVHAANSAAALGIPEARLDMVRCGIAVYGMDPFHEDPAATGSSPRSSCAPTSPRSSAARRGRAPATAAASSPARRPGSGRCRSATPTACAAALTNDCDVLVGGRRVPLVGTVSMDNITVDLGPDAAAARQRGGPARPPGRRARARRGVGAAARDDQLRDHVRDRRRGCRARTTATGSRAVTVARARRPPRRRAGARRAPGVAWSSAARCATGCSAARPTTSTSRSPGDPERGRARRWPARRAAPRSGSRARSAPGAWSARSTPGTSTSCRCATATSAPTSRARDFTINAMAEPLAGGELLDPHGGRADLDARRLRMVGPRALADDPLRDAARGPAGGRARAVASSPPTAAEIGAARARARAASPPSACSGSSSGSSARPPRARRPRAAWRRTGCTAQVLPELPALRGVEQTVFHHLDVHDHTLAVLDQVVAHRARPRRRGPRRARRAPSPALLRRAAGRRAHARRGDALRRAAARRGEAADARASARTGRVGFIGHDREGAERRARRPAPAARLASGSPATSRRSCLHHLRLGFLVHERPLDRRDGLALPAARRRRARSTSPSSPSPTGSPRAGATPSRRSRAHLELARELLGHALRRRGRPAGAARARRRARPRARASSPGPRSASCSPSSRRTASPGEIATREDALGRARAGAARDRGAEAASATARRGIERVADATASATRVEVRLAATSRCEW